MLISSRLHRCGSVNYGNLINATDELMINTLKSLTGWTAAASLAMLAACGGGGGGGGARGADRTFHRCIDLAAVGIKQLLA